MSLSTDEVNAVRAVWEEWTADAGFELAIEIVEISDGVHAGVERGRLMARLTSSLRCRVQVRRGKTVVFDELIPCKAEALRASVTVLARTIAAT